MLYTLKHVLGSDQITQAQSLLTQTQFVDGKLSAGTLAQKVKHNSEVAQNEPVLEQLNQIVMQNLVRHRQYLKAARPHSIAQPFYVRYDQNMHYGSHIDDPIMGPTSQRYRCDMAITLFLNDPREYEGGELVIEHDYGNTSVKGKAGDAVLYPATSVHHVAPVTQGHRLVAVTWVQSVIRNHEQRHLLHELDQTLDHMIRKGSDEKDIQRIQYVYANLVRQWSEL